MACTPAPALTRLSGEVKNKWPGAVTGICGERSNKSDHPVGNAIDVMTNAAGVDGNWLAAHLIGKRDPRITYVIWNRRIYGPGSRYGWTGGAYTGSNPHTDHVHVSIAASARDSTGDWGIGQGGGISVTDVLGQAAAGAAGIPSVGPLWPGAPDIPGLDNLAKLGSFLSDPLRWKRAAMAILGSIIIIAGVVILLADSKVAKTAVGGLVKVKTGGAVDLDGPETGPAPTPAGASL